MGRIQSMIKIRTEKTKEKHARGIQSMSRTSRIVILVVIAVAEAEARLAKSMWSKNAEEGAFVRDYLYVGGSYGDDGNGVGEHIFRDQMYVERLRPSPGPPTQCYPIVLIHGQAQTGTNWLNTPDGRQGWASWLVHAGYEVLIVDQTARGRSALFPRNGTQSTLSAEMLQRLFTAPEHFNLWPQAALHTQWPGKGLIGDWIFDAYYASTVQFVTDPVWVQQRMKAAGVALLDRVGPVILVGHSQGGIFPWLIADARPSLVKAIVAIEPTGPPFRNFIVSNSSGRAWGITDIPVTYRPAVHDPKVDLLTEEQPTASPTKVACVLQKMPAKKLVNLEKIPVLVETSEASFHALYDHCTVEYLRQAGVPAEHLVLPDVGIHGNGHMQMMEKNNVQIIWVIESWITNKTAS